MNSSLKSNLQLIVTSHDSGSDVITSISGLSTVIRDIRDAIDDFSIKHNDLKIQKVDKGFKLSPKAYMAIQHVIYKKII